MSAVPYVLRSSLAIGSAPTLTPLSSWLGYWEGSSCSAAYVAGLFGL